MYFFFFFSSRRRHTRCREVSWARRCVQETVSTQSTWGQQGQLVDALAPRGDERRSRLRQATVRSQTSFDPWISEWGNPAGVMSGYSLAEFIGPVSYTHLTLPTILLVQISVVAVSLKKKKS
eukprot:TRINITY_DN5074_c0_g1_i3.p2 TRINITY_DN5074_c0_g1~~TRINITY_DN5074_c0_g1_i3.p2  ORF type:complete len:122 (+),score=46.99 TRINITY_DN5074_c0_g1_i3:77-442(+)